MDLDDIAQVTTPRRLAGRAAWRPEPSDPDTPGCPGCGATLQIAPVAPTEPDRSVGVCPAHQCGEVVTFRRLEGRLIVAERRRR